MNIYLRNDIVKRLAHHDIDDIATFVNEAVEKALDVLDIGERERQDEPEEAI